MGARYRAIKGIERSGQLPVGAGKAKRAKRRAGWLGVVVAAWSRGTWREGVGWAQRLMGQ
jgi:hypothetical protein